MTVKQLKAKREQVKADQTAYNDGVKRILADIKRKIKETK